MTPSRSQLLGNRLKHLFYRFIAHKKFLVAHCPKYGLKFKFFVRDGVGRDIYYKYGVYAEDFITDYLLKSLGLRDEDLVIDIGSNIGWYSLVLSSQARPMVLSFEPDPLNFSLLEHNIRINGRQNIRSFNLAVDNVESVKTLHLYKSYNLGRHSFIPHEKCTGSVEVKTVVLDKFLPKLGLKGKPVKFLKIDIEGYEYLALLGAEKTLQNTSVVLSEFSPSAMKTIEQDPLALVGYLQNLGFTPAHFEQSGLSACDFPSMIRSQNVFNLLWRRV
ncbi:MAG: FkbM family methyltransferase [Gammaproteobacteria bacterium]